MYVCLLDAMAVRLSNLLRNSREDHRKYVAFYEYLPIQPFRLYYWYLT